MGPRRGFVRGLHFAQTLGILLAVFFLSATVADDRKGGVKQQPFPMLSNRSSWQIERFSRPSPDEPEKAMRWRRLSWLNEKRKIPRDALITALQQREQNLAYWKNHSGIPAPGFNFRAALAPWVSRGPQNVGGRTRILVIHPSNNSILWAGSVGGGIWKSTDAGSTWIPLDDFLPNLAANTLAIDPANANVLYCGTGEGYFNGDALNGAGIFKTTKTTNCPLNPRS